MMGTLRPLSVQERAEHLLRHTFAPAGDEPVSRINALNSLGGSGNANLAKRREWAIAWQLLQRVGFICREPDSPRNGDWWFLTPAGRTSLKSDFEGSLLLALRQP